ncbi:MAG: DUF2779 domain-containing protein [Cyclobacteriaceae bacterium]|nr:DUF2779 domain-containing protein [Cyclobacteriaceae bacterium]
MPAVPMFDNSRPYQQIPFQFSLHIQKKKGGKLEHIKFLHTGNDDPRSDLIKALISSCGDKGSVIVYNKSFEATRNNELARDFPDYVSELQNINDRMVDLKVPFSSRNIYHPDMQGAASLKNVLPAFVLGMSYENLEISEGETASLLYLSCIKGMVAEEEKKKIYENLREYCGQDTLAEVRLIEVLYTAAILLFDTPGCLRV